MHPGIHAASKPTEPAAINSDNGTVLTWQQLDARSNQLVHYLRSQGMERGDRLAIFMENNLRFFEVAWAALRSGCLVTTVNRFFTADEAQYVINDCGARAVISSLHQQDVAGALPALLADCPVRLMVDGTMPGWHSYEDAIADQPTAAVEPQWLGGSMLYSSGTTGRPKGIKRPLSDDTVAAGLPLNDWLGGLYGIGPDTRYLSPAPLYHAAPFGFCLSTQSLGGTVVMMPKFDPMDALRCIQAFGITHSQWVPTMFVRMLKLAETERQQYDLSSLKVAIHAAAPCPQEVKRQMIDWWGPVLHEYYAGSEVNGITVINSEDWLQHPGSVGRAMIGIVHICDQAGNELPAGEAGLVYFEQEMAPFEYYNDPAKTRDSQNPLHRNWTTLGDIGYVDGEGYLYLTDRQAFTIISGGVNIYPQEVEDALILHPNVADVAVFGIPDAEFGEQVKAVVQVADGIVAGPELAATLIEFCRDRLAHYMVPRSVDFIAEMPRLPTGKLYKRVLQAKYTAPQDPISQ